MSELNLEKKNGEQGELNPEKKKKKKNGERGGVRPCHACGHGRGR